MVPPRTRVPIAHGTIPQAGQLQGQQFATVLALRTNEACRLINKLRQVEPTSLVVLDSTHQVDGIKMVPEVNISM